MPIDVMLLLITYRCNLRCPFCLAYNGYWYPGSDYNFPHAKVEKEMCTSDIIERVIPQAIENGINAIALSGGEVLVRSDAVEIFNALGKAEIEWCLDSNLTLCSGELAEEIVKASCNAVFTSIDGPIDVHNMLRNNKISYDRCIEGIKRLINARKQFGDTRMKILINTVVQPGNEDVLHEVAVIACELGADGISYQMMSSKKFEKRIKADEVLVSLNEAEKISDEAGISFEIYPISKPGITDVKSWFSNSQKNTFYKGCSYISQNVRIDPAGNVIPCIEYKLGNILNRDLMDIWNGNEFKTFREYIKTKGPIDGCLRCCNMSV